MKILMIVLILAIVLLLILASRKPNSFRVERSILVNAPAHAIFQHINDFHAWSAWSPWEHIDPNLQRSYSGADFGVGAKYAWVGNNKVGQGHMAILESREFEFIKVDLHFIKPFAAHNTAEFTLKQQLNETTVSWVMYGPSPLMSKIMGMFMNMDKMIGGQFETGLQTLKKVVDNHVTKPLG